MKWHNLRGTCTALLVEIIYLHLANDPVYLVVTYR